MRTKRVFRNMSNAIDSFVQHGCGCHFSVKNLFHLVECWTHTVRNWSDMKWIKPLLVLFDGTIWIISINLKIKFEIKINNGRNHRWSSTTDGHINDHIIHKYRIFSSVIHFHLSHLISIEVWIRSLWLTLNSSRCSNTLSEINIKTKTMIPTCAFDTDRGELLQLFIRLYFGAI